jgi:formate dehydrogenase beta subunit
MIVQSLREIQNQFGFLPDKELERLAETIGIPMYRIQEVASFFLHFRREWDKPAEVEIKVCRDMTCHLRGSEEFVKSLKSSPEFANLTSDQIKIDTVSCLGRCDRGPVAWVEHAKHDLKTCSHDHAVYANRSANDLKQVALQALSQHELPKSDLDATYRVNRNPKWMIDVYQNDNRLAPYSAVRQFANRHARIVDPPPPTLTTKLDDYLKEKHPDLLKLKQSKLLGMGGAGVPIATKWQDVWLAAGSEKYIICNGDESEPGTFKDRELLLNHPHLIVEGVIMGCLMTGAERGIIFVRHEYSEQIEALNRECARAYRIGAAGKKIFGSTRTVEVEVFESPGGYICGEQSALIEAMSDRRAQPRNRPPELATNGLFDSPTAVNNVETLAWVPGILIRGPEWYLKQTDRAGVGHRFFSISGDLHRPGVFEVPIGLTLGELIQDYAGGLIGELGAVATSGPSGGFLPALLPIPGGWEQRLERKIKTVRTAEEQAVLTDFCNRNLQPLTPINDQGTVLLEVRTLLLDLLFFRNVGGVLGIGVDLMLGAGLVVYNRERDILSQAQNATAFFRNESCGKCVPCRIGSEKLVTISTDLLHQQRDRAKGKFSRPVAKEIVNEMGSALAQTSICGLGQVAANPISTWLTLFPDNVSEGG